MNYMAILRNRTPESLIGANTPEVKEFTLRTGINGNVDTINFMIKVARERSRHPAIRQLALRIIESFKVQSNDYINEALAIGQWVKQKTRYCRDINGVETLHDPLTMIDMIKRGEAHLDCDDQALLTATLLLSIGHQPYFRVIRYSNKYSGWQHIYTVVYEKNHNTKKQRIVLDTILKRRPLGYENRHVSGKEFKV